MASFTLNDATLGTLGGGLFSTQPFRMAGPFRDIQFSLTQAGLDQNCEPHYFEFHYTLVGVVEATGVS